MSSLWPVYGLCVCDSKLPADIIWRRLVIVACHQMAGRRLQTIELLLKLLSICTSSRFVFVSVTDLFINVVATSAVIHSSQNSTFLTILQVIASTRARWLTEYVGVTIAVNLYTVAVPGFTSLWGLTGQMSPTGIQRKSPTRDPGDKVPLKPKV